MVDRRGHFDGKRALQRREGLFARQRAEVAPTEVVGERAAVDFVEANGDGGARSGFIRRFADATRELLQRHATVAQALAQHLVLGHARRTLRRGRLLLLYHRQQRTDGGALLAGHIGFLGQGVGLPRRIERPRPRAQVRRRGTARRA